jgi:hypothetical protein
MSAQKLFDEICASLEDRANRSKMFGAPCMKTPNGKAAFCFYKDMLVIKLDKETQNETLSWDGVSMFNPMGERPMNGWLQVGFEYAKKWPALAKASVDFVEKLEANVPKPKKAKA